MSASTEISPSIKIVDTLPSLISFLDDLNSALTISTCTSTLYLSITPRNTATPYVLIIHWILPHLPGTPQNSETYLLDFTAISTEILMNTHSSNKSLTMMQYTHAPPPGQAHQAETPEYISLKTLFESPYISKILFDVRDISHFLYTKCDISLAGVKDIQLMELAVRAGGKDKLRGLAKCVELHSPLPSAVKKEWEAKRTALQKIEIRTRGQRPMEPEVMQYYALSVDMLPRVYDVLRKKLEPGNESFWRSHVEAETNERIKEAKNPQYNMQEQGRVYSPWNDDYVEAAIDGWNDDVLAQASEEAEAEYDRLDDYLQEMRMTT
ncbi:hypothetical protein OCU04_012442 [Sclerotinia nivalis]|uniref:3'-5' exonuclease domain-containing protein n=1 Tax=Sclerotinia nivalis TaxID=352851 RepID=A0A9X0DEW4_9HELO|nr:hypothetical protein OCU04_012442 [Sclerotinia nivalis]